MIESEYDALMEGVLDDPQDTAPKGALADWLDDHDKPGDAIRFMARLGRWPDSWYPGSILSGAGAGMSGVVFRIGETGTGWYDAPEHRDPVGPPDYWEWAEDILDRPAGLPTWVHSRMGGDYNKALLRTPIPVAGEGGGVRYYIAGRTTCFFKTPREAIEGLIRAWGQLSRPVAEFLRVATKDDLGGIRWCS
jgi:uncharacterized protein (TIGR02996 family)